MAEVKWVSLLGWERSQDGLIRQNAKDALAPQVLYVQVNDH
jgi:hypothetical protein